MREQHPRITLMNGLYYPAVLGTGLVLLLNKFAHHKSVIEACGDTSNYIAILLLVYFSVSFLLNHTIDNDKYGNGAFIADFVEIVLIFLGFYFLGFVEPRIPDPADYQPFYWSLAAVPILQQVWNRAVGFRDNKLWILAAIASGLLVVAAIWGYQYLWFNIVMIVVLGGVLVVYVTYLRQDAK